MFNVTGSEVVILLLLALVILGPEKLPDAIRRFGKVYGELRKMSQGFQTELRDALDEPMRELRSTADMARKAIEEPANEISSSAKGMGQAATDAFAAATKFSAAPVQGGGIGQHVPATADETAERPGEVAAGPDQPASDQPASDQPASVQPTSEQPVLDLQVADQPVSEEWPEAAAAPMDDPGDEGDGGEGDRDQGDDGDGESASA